MKINLVLLILLFGTLTKSYAQMNKAYIDLKDKLFEFENLKAFIAHDFIPVSHTKFELRQNNHPVELYKFNREWKPGYLPPALIGITITNIYAYWQDDEHVCLYILLPINNHKEIDRLSDLIGLPWNVTEEDYKSGDFGSLMWQKDNLEIVLTKNFDYSNPQSGNLIIITNIKLAKLANDAPW